MAAHVSGLIMILNRDTELLVFHELFNLPEVVKHILFSLESISQLFVLQRLYTALAALVKRNIVWV